MGTVKCIGILTSGGDAPGMNAAIRAVTRAAIYNGLQVKGIYRGYKGLVTGEIKEFKSQNVSNIIQLGGTILKTARCKEFTTPEGRQLAYDNMKKEGIDALVIIGGDGSLTGARIFAQEFDVPCIGLPGTIDNDLYGTDTTIGYDTALNTILDAVDKIRDTATSHERLFFVEVMGRDAGFLALNGAIASGAEAAIIPEFSTEVDQLEEFIKNGFRKSKNSSIVLVAESELTGGATSKKAQRLKDAETGSVNKLAKCRKTPRAGERAPDGVTHDTHYTMAEVLSTFNIKYGRFYEVRNRYQLQSVHAWGTTCFKKEDVERVIGLYNEEQGKNISDDWYTCFDIMKLYGLGKTQVRRFAETHGVRIRKFKGGRANYYLKADWEAARKKAEKSSKHAMKKSA